MRVYLVAYEQSNGTMYLIAACADKDEAERVQKEEVNEDGKHPSIIPIQVIGG